MEYDELPSADIVALLDEYRRRSTTIGPRIIACALRGDDPAAVFRVALDSLVINDVGVVACVIEAIEHLYWFRSIPVDLSELNARLATVNPEFVNDELVSANLESLCEKLKFVAMRDGKTILLKRQGMLINTVPVG